jgi:hypothetical protein
LFVDAFSRELFLLMLLPIPFYLAGENTWSVFNLLNSLEVSHTLPHALCSSLNDSLMGWYPADGTT